MQFVGLADGYVDVQTEGRSDRPCEQVADDLPAIVHGRFEVGIGRVVVEREAHGRTAVEAPLDGGAHRSRVEYVDGRVGAVVDARYDQVDPFFAQQVVEGHLHAVDRRAREGIDLHARFLAYASQKQGFVHGDGLAHAALRRLGSHRYHAAESFHRFDGGGQSLRGVSVVVGDQYQSFVHAFGFLSMANIRIICRDRSISVAAELHSAFRRRPQAVA